MLILVRGVNKPRKLTIFLEFCPQGLRMTAQNGTSRSPGTTYLDFEFLQKIEGTMHKLGLNTSVGRKNTSGCYQHQRKRWQQQPSWKQAILQSFPATEELEDSNTSVDNNLSLWYPGMAGESENMRLKQNQERGPFDVGVTKGKALMYNNVVIFRCFGFSYHKLL